MTAKEIHIFDVPGPKAKARYRLIALGTVIICGLIAAFIIYRFVDTGQFSSRKWSIFTYSRVWQGIAMYTFATLKAFAFSAVLSMVLGIFLAVGYVSDHAWVRYPVKWFLEIFRAIPVLILMMLMYYGMPSIGIKVTPFFSVVTALTFYNGTILAEAIRSGILALPRGQSEAGHALGMRKYRVMVDILLPQAFRHMAPVIIAQLGVILKDTALGFIITYRELLDYARALGTQRRFDFPLIPAALLVGTIYVLLCMAIASLAKYAESYASHDKAAQKRENETWGNTNLAIAQVHEIQPGTIAVNPTHLLRNEPIDVLSVRDRFHIPDVPGPQQIKTRLHLAKGPSSDPRSHLRDDDESSQKDS